MFVIADTHFGHKKIVEYQAAARPFASIEEHDRELVRRWNVAVNPRYICVSVEHTGLAPVLLNGLAKP